jgi:quercetin dioxygenase-like cupin family protein
MNVLENLPFSDEKLGNRKLVDTKPLLVMQVALRKGQSVPRHNANSHVHLLVQLGDIEVDLNGVKVLLKSGDLQPVAFETRMTISNSGEGDAAFLILKAPNPSEMA